MDLQTARKRVHPDEMEIPPAPTPRPGDAVVWYVDSQRATGRYVGHAAKAKPVVANVFGSQSKLTSFDCVRILKPKERIGPNWQYLPNDALYRPLDKEAEMLRQILQSRIPPGPTYFELIEEIWHRGYEIYVVGGTVRDVVSGEKPNDVDIVTTMPLAKFEVLLASMFKNMVSVREINGYARLGGKGEDGDPFIDLKLFCHGGTGTPDALFGSDFKLDLGLRDFACNAIYFDPMNQVLIDPSLRGLADARNRILSLVCDSTARPPAARGQIAIRYFKFLMRGYAGDPISDVLLLNNFIPCISSLTASHRLAYVRRQILGKIARDSHAAALKNLELVMDSAGFGRIWKELFEPIVSLTETT